jgi:beta-phosphoglucomutase-like phosphatase (HAD superfamily)
MPKGSARSARISPIGAKATHAELYPDAVAVLEALHARGRRIALVTTSRHDRIDTALARHKIEYLFAAVVCGDDVKNLKPSAEPVEKPCSY